MIRKISTLALVVFEPRPTSHTVMVAATGRAEPRGTEATTQLTMVWRVRSRPSATTAKATYRA